MTFAVPLFLVRHRFFDSPITIGVIAGLAVVILLIAEEVIRLRRRRPK